MKARPRAKSRLFFVLFIFSFLLIFSPSVLTVHSMQLHLFFDQLVEKADLVFLGTVVGQQSRYGPNFNMIFTDVRFAIEQVIHRRPDALPVEGSELVLTFAGGQVGEEVIRVSDVPTLETGVTYLVLTRWDGKTYASPIIGAYQGLFRVIHDEVTGLSYALTYGKQCLKGIEKGKLITGPPVTRIRGGTIERRPTHSPIQTHKEVPKAVQGIGARVSSVVRMREQRPEKIMTLDDLLQEIISRAGKDGGKEGRP